MSTTTPPSNKVKIHFVPVGSAPIMKRAKFQVGSDDKVASLSTFLRKMLKLDTSHSLFLYCSSSFVPGPEEKLKDVHDCFGSRGELVVHYSLQEAWG